MKKTLALLLSLVLVFSLAACGGNTKGKEIDKNVMPVALASEPDTIDPALNTTVDGATLVSHLFAGLAKWSQKEDGTLEIVADCAKELTEGVVNPDGTITYTYELKDGLKWSDGKDLTAEDFVFAWNRSASLELGADYGYMLEIVDGYAEMTEADEDGKPVNPDAKLNAKALDEKTIEVTLTTPVTYWNELLAFPSYYPIRKDVVENESWATSPETYVSNGCYVLSDWKHDSVITLTKNENYYDAEKVTMPTIKFYLSDDANNMLTNFKKGDWLLIDNVPTNEMANLAKDYEKEYNVVGQLGNYYVCWNVNEDILPESSELTGVDAENARAEIRKAVSLLFDRNYIVEKIAQGGQVPASSFVAMGLTNPDGTEFYKTAGSSKDYVGYFDVSKDAFENNFNSAVETLKKYYDFDEAAQKFTNVPSLTYIYNTDDVHKAVGEYIQGALAQVGIDVQLTNQEWKTFINTRKAGDYSIARNGWLADYNDPISFIDMWISNSGNNDCQLGKGDHAKVKAYSLDLTEYGYDIKVENGTWAETYDVLISTIKTCKNEEVRYKLMHLAEDMIMSTGAITPLYFYTDIYMLSERVDGFFSNPLGYKYFMYTTIK